MTTNKPEVVAWRWRKPVVNDQGETIGFTGWKLSESPEFLPWWENDPLVCLGDYETLQAERRAPGVEGLVEALEEITNWVERWITPDHPIATVARRALSYHKGGDV